MDGITDSMDMSLSRLQELLGDGQGSLVCCGPYCCKEVDTIVRLNSTDSMWEEMDSDVCVCVCVRERERERKRERERSRLSFFQKEHLKILLRSHEWQRGSIPF